MLDAYISGESVLNTKPPESVTITQNVINELNATLTKSGKAILLALYQTPRIQQKVLAVNIKTSTTSLSNLLSKLEHIRPPLLNIEYSGRSKYYSLTKIAEQYVSKELLFKESYNISTFFTVPANGSLLNNTLNTLYQFQSIAGSEWLVVLDDMLYNGVNTIENKNELSNLYTQFINNMNQLYMQQELLSIQKIYDTLNNSILVKRLENYLKSNLKDHHALIPLFDLEKQNSKKAIQLIDYTFAEIKPSIWPDDLSLFSNDLPVSGEQYHAIFHKLSMMANEYSIQYESKAQAIKNWENIFYTSNASLIWIADKCNTIKLMESRKFAH